MTSRWPAEQPDRSVADLPDGAPEYRVLAENATDIVWRIELDDTMTWISPSIQTVLGWAPDELLGTKVRALIHPDDQAATRDWKARIVAGEKVGPLESRRLCADGSYRWLSLFGRPTTDDSGAVGGIVIGSRDIQDELMTRLALADSERRYRLVAENATDAVFLSDPAGTLTWASPACQRILGFEPADLVGVDARSLIHPEDLPIVAGRGPATEADSSGSHFEFRVRTASGEHRWMSAVSNPTKDSDGEILGSISTLRDIHYEVLARRALARSEQTFRKAMEGAPTGMAVVAPNQRFLQVNPALCAMLKREECWLLSATIADVVHPEDLAKNQAACDRLLGPDATTAASECRWRTADGRDLWVLHSTALVRDENQSPLFFVCHIQDTTDARRVREELTYRANHDALTGLMNPDQFVARVSNHLRSFARPDVTCAAFFIDLDHFKAVNDTYGHEVGNTVLRESARRIRATLRVRDATARLGGDEFAAFLPDVPNLSTAVAIAHKIRAALAQPIPSAVGTVTTTASLGIAFAINADDAEQLLHNADTALYEAKRAGRNRIATFAESASP
ncbi:MAG: PAS domain S-box protein [Actinomycetes bacterium]